MEINVGDRVQIRSGAVDVSNGVTAKAGKMYGDGGPLWATIESISSGYKTSNKYGLPSVITKVRCTDATGNVVVWQVQDSDVVNVISASAAKTTNVSGTPAASSNSTTVNTANMTTQTKSSKSYNTVESRSVSSFVPDGRTDRNNSVNSSSGRNTLRGSWNYGTNSSTKTDGINISNPTAAATKKITPSSIGTIEDIAYPNAGGTWRDLTTKEKANIGTNHLQVDTSVLDGSKQRTSWQNPDKKAEMLNNKPDEIQNSSGFPYKISDPASQLAAKYDYRILPGDSRYSKSVSLETKLREARAQFGIQVHGNNNIGKAVTYYMYNRYKQPDPNIALSKLTTHVFFTRPDLNILRCSGGQAIDAADQVKNHTEAAMLFKRNPEIFKLLTDGTRCGDGNNFNMLLSNQVVSFQLTDEQLSTIESNKTWNDYSIFYGDAYSGRTGGEFQCTFSELYDLSIINMIKLWITYIDNVSRGAWSPSYNLFGSGVSHNSFYDSHVYMKELDYACAVNVLKCGPEGEEIYYWTKYYGVYPITTGVSALSYDATQGISNNSQIPITFKYSFKKDMSPISLIEFNDTANLDSYVSIDSYNPKYNQSYRPIVGVPFIEMSLGSSQMKNHGYNTNRQSTNIRLKFTSSDKADSALSDNVLFKTNLHK